VQNIVPPSDKHHEEASMAKHISNNNYMNANPSNIIPIPSGICIPDCVAGDATIIADLGQESAKEHHGDFNETRDSEACSEITKMKPLSQSSVDEIDSASQGQESAGMKYEQEHVPTDSANVLRNTNKATETKMPEYMNLAVNMGHDAINSLGAIPKKLPAPPVPPRGMTFRDFANGANIQML
jgi:hypothetical protein